MSRLRVTLSSLPLDREVASRVEAAQREILAALRACRGREENPVQRRRVLAVRRDLERILATMSDVRRVGALYDVDDPDLIEAPAPSKKPKPEAPAPTPIDPPVEGE